MSQPPRTLPLPRPDVLAPPPAYAALRASAPVAAVTTPEGQRAWLVTSYDAVVTVLTDERFGVTPPGGYPGNDTLFQDGPAHTRLRGLVGKVFTPRRITALRPRIEELASGYVAAVAQAGPPADLVDTLAAPLSIALISELLGVAVDDRAEFRRVADTALLKPGADVDPAAGWQALVGYAAGLVAAKRANLGDDLLSDLITVRDADDGRLSDDELVAMAATLVISGYLSACNAISVGALQLITTGRLSDLAGDTGTVDAVVDEVLRRQSGLTGEAMPRWAHADVELAGVPLKAGDMVLARLEAANRDPRQFPEPDRFLPERAPTHVAFGRGPHHCLGAALARFEVAAALRALALQLPGVRLAGPVEGIPWTEGQVDIGPAGLHVIW